MPRGRSRQGRSAVLALVVGVEVLQRVLRRRTEVVVGAEDEQPWVREQAVEGLDHRWQGLRVGEVVAGIDHQVRLERGELRRPRPA